VTLYVYNWGEYISDGYEGSLNVNDEFEAYCKDELGLNVKVNYSTYSSNEDLYAKLSSGAVKYDVIVPSDYMIARLAAEGLLAEINPLQNIENYSNIDDEFKGLYYDPEEKYSVPYTYGTVGIIYNSDLVSTNDEDFGKWDLLWDNDYQGNILQFNNPRDAFGTAQFYLGYSINSNDSTEWENALEALKAQKPIVQGYVMDEIFNKMKGGSAAIAPYYAGDFFTMYADNELLDFYYPEGSTNVFVDAMCVPANSPNPELAVEYINFMLTKEIAIANAEYICYASPNKLVFQDEEYIQYMEEEVHPDAMSILYEFDMAEMEFYHDLPTETRMLMNELWEELKIESSIGYAVYVICYVIIGVIIIGAVWYFVRKKKRESLYD
jgi:spermidine/putrescine transport system substrate-binding protein